MHGAALLLLAALPFALGLYRNGTVFLWLLLCIWPAACFFSPFLLASAGLKWYFCVTPAPVFFIIPLCALLTPPGLAYLGAYPVLYALIVLPGYFVGRRRRNKKNRAAGR